MIKLKNVLAVGLAGSIALAYASVGFAQSATRAEAKTTKDIVATLKVKSSPEAVALALQHLETLAAGGDTNAMSALGDIYREGRVTTPDVSKALIYYRAALAREDNSVLLKLGNLYYRNAADIGGDPKEAIGFYQQAIDKGDIWALASLGEVYREGRIVPQDLQKALGLFREAAAKGNYSALTKIGDIYYRFGGALGLNPAEALDFYKQAADKGDFWATAALADVYREGKLVPQDLSKAEALLSAESEKGNVAASSKLADLYARYADDLKVDSARAVDLYQQAVVKGDASAMSGLGEIYSAGKIVPQDLPKALALYQQAEASGNSAVFTKLGDFYSRYAEQLKLDPTKAEDYYRKAADKGDSWGLVGLGDLYRAGKLVPQDLSKALAYYEEAAGKGNNGVFTKLGDLYYRSSDVLKIDPSMAIEYYQKAAERGDSYAIVGLGDVYRDGKIVQVDLPKALSLYGQAAAAGNRSVFTRIGMLYYRDALVLKVDAAKAIEYFQKGMGAGDATAVSALADIYREGKLVSRDLNKALALYETSYADGNARAYASIVDLLMRGRPAQQKRGIAMIGTGISQNIPGLVPIWADSYINGRGVARNPRNGMKILKEAADMGDAPAAFRLIQLYVQGYGKLIPKNPSAAAKLIDSLKGKIPVDRLAAERLYVTGAAARSQKEMRAFVAELQTQTPFAQSSIVGRVSWINQNAYVYALQALMIQTGSYNGSVNGLLTSLTAGAMYRECIKLAAPSVCGAGPLSDTVRPILSNLFRLRVKA